MMNENLKEGMMKKIIIQAAFALLIAVSCAVKQDPDTALQNSISLPRGISIQSTGLIDYGLLRLLPASLRISNEGSIIYIDPFHAPFKEKAELILITHPHFDHFQPQVIKELSSSNTTVICPKVMEEEFDDLSPRLMLPGDRLKVGGIKVEAYPSYNTNEGFFGIVAHPKGEAYNSYIIEIDGLRIYHAGDSDYIEEMNDIQDIHTAILPVDGGELTMSTADAARATKAMGAELLVPVHYDIKKGGAIAKELEQLLDTSSIKWLVPPATNTN